MAAYRVSGTDLDGGGILDSAATERELAQVAERVAEMRKPEVRARILADRPTVQGHPLMFLAQAWNWIFPLTDEPESTRLTIEVHGAVAGLIQLLACTAEKVFYLGQAGADLLRLELQQAVSSFTGIAFRLELDQLFRKLVILSLTLRNLRYRRFHLCL